MWTAVYTPRPQRALDDPPRQVGPRQVGPRADSGPRAPGSTSRLPAMASPAPAPAPAAGPSPSPTSLAARPAAEALVFARAPAWQGWFRLATQNRLFAVGFALFLNAVAVISAVVIAATNPRRFINGRKPRDLRAGQRGEGASEEGSERGIERAGRAGPGGRAGDGDKEKKRERETERETERERSSTWARARRRGEREGDRGVGVELRAEGDESEACGERLSTSTVSVKAARPRAAAPACPRIESRTHPPASS